MFFYSKKCRKSKKEKKEFKTETIYIQHCDKLCTSYKLELHKNIKN